MTSKEFIIWIRGFSEGVHEYNITPKQWETFKEKLGQVDDNIIPIGGVIIDHNTFKVPNDQGFYQNPYGTRGPETPTGTTLTTTPGTTGQITIANPNIASFGSVSSITYTTGSGLGVGVTYTKNELPNWYSTIIPEDKTLLND